ncbi:hypothetical protein EX30DRAFT_301851 [Ascodesmis nigricans]|uniref:Rab-GAP TBC domain-containing protein n=1 Tax=Ascodesmis nigricans TaxID=341454 RepID=A0A4S2N6R9_9PEZI|nr:hypothetical protein EX30DRAFT_301851 [Ascodesmis nigricans]
MDALPESFDNEKAQTSPPQSPALAARALDPRQKEKFDAIRLACRDHDVVALTELALSDEGLMSDNVRKEAWPILLGASRSREQCDAENEKKSSWKKLPPHPDENQVKLDVDRSFIYYPTDVTPRELGERKDELYDLIVEVLRRHPMLGYFQGFHDICQVFLLVLGPERSVTAIEHIALLRIRDFMLPTMGPALDHLQLLFPLLQAVDPKLCAHISLTQPFFALAATLTLYAHDITEYSDIARLFDAFIALDQVFPLYLFAQIVIERRDELLSIPDDEPEMLHVTLSKLPKPLDLDGLISRAIELQKQHPPHRLSTWRRVSRYSVLKATPILRNSSSKPSPAEDLAKAEILFRKHCEEMERTKRRQEMLQALQKRRKPLIVTLTVFIAVVSVGLELYNRKHHGASMSRSVMLGVGGLWRILKG